MYCLAKAHRHNPSESDPVFIANEWIIYNFLLITLWAVIFIINILFCDGERGVAGIIVTTIWSGVEWIVLLLLAVLTIVEIRRSKPGYTGTPETQPLLPGQPDTTHTLLKKVFLKNLIFFLSYTLCTLVLVLGIDLHLPVLFNVIAFFLTAPHHIALYISSARPSSPFKFFPFLATFTGVPYAFFLSAAWIGVVILNILMSRYLYQAILVGVFGSLECAIVSYLAIRSVLDDLAEEQIKL
ncbi:hypothetical protein H0H87_010259 [Tephrocybe sp. NHM501043]|nr:hypothetical protein H0H87_010259 [Tephrocybe sp. NHM501043]